MEKRNIKPVKILIATGIYPPDIGGPATMLGALADSLTSRGLAVKILTFSDIKTNPSEEGRVWRINRAWPWRHLNYFGRLLWLALWANLLYVTDTYSVGYFVYLIKKFLGKKYIVRFAGDSAWETAVACGWTQDYIVDFQQKKYDSRVEKLKQRRTKILINADKVIAVSNFIASLAGKIGVAKNKIYVIYNAVDFFGETPLKQEPAAPTLVFAGRLMPWKGVEMLLAVVAKLKTRWPDIVFEILGDGPEEKKLKVESEKLKVAENVIFHGRVSEEESHKIFARSTIFVLNTNYEGLPHAVLNAMQVGVPVITTSLGGNLEVVTDGENGLLVSYNDEEAWLTAISRLLEDQDLQQKFVANGQKTLEKFKWNKLVDKTVEVINNLK